MLAETSEMSSNSLLETWAQQRPAQMRLRCWEFSVTKRKETKSLRRWGCWIGPIICDFFSHTLPYLQERQKDPSSPKL